MSPVSFMILVSLCSAPGRRWQKRIKPYNHVGFGTSIPALKKSQDRRGGDSLRRRSQLPPRPYPLSYLGTDRFSAGNSDHGTEEHAQDFRNNRTILRQVPLSFSKSVQCRNVHRVSRKNFAMLLSTESIFDSRQCIVQQRSGCMGMVFRSSEIYRGLQSSRVFSQAQCAGKNMASYPYQRHTQPILRDSAGATLDFNFNVSKHSREAIANPRLSATSSIVFMALYLCNAIECFIPLANLPASLLLCLPHYSAS